MDHRQLSFGVNLFIFLQSPCRRVTHMAKHLSHDLMIIITITIFIVIIVIIIIITILKEIKGDVKNQP